MCGLGEFIDFYSRKIYFTVGRESFCKLVDERRRGKVDEELDRNFGS